MPTIAFPNNTTEVIDNIRSTIGRQVTIYRLVSGIACSGCGLDPVTNLSLDSFCSICDGNYWINTTSGIAVTGRILHGGLDRPIWEPGGLIVAGETQLRIKYTPVNKDAVDNMQYCVIDSKKFILKEFEYRGVPDVNRIVITLEEKEKDG